MRLILFMIFGLIGFFRAIIIQDIGWAAMSILVLVLALENRANKK